MAPEADVLINVEIGSESDVLKELKKIENVTAAEAVCGVYDIIARVRGKDNDELNETVTWRIRRLDKVRSTLKLAAIEDASFIRDDLLPANSPELKTPEKCAYRAGRDFRETDFSQLSKLSKVTPSIYSLNSIRMNGAALHDFMSGQTGSELVVYGQSKGAGEVGDYCSQGCRLFNCNLNEHKDNPKHVIKI